MSAATDSAIVQPSFSRGASFQQITLVDHTEPAASEQDPQQGPLSPVESSLSKRLTRQSIQQQLAQRKYARYREDKYITQEDAGEYSGAEETNDQLGRLRKSKNKVRGLLKTKKQFQQAHEEDAVLDVLYENQRGWFFFGMPHFSSRSLLNFDPKPWLNGHKKASPVNITNAQVPDPSWEWAWKSWYVDMSRDVDEEGWEYSFWFSEGVAWHGTHPWGHSWVRRRRWLRKRVRKYSHHGEGRIGGQKHMSEAHTLAPDYFTVHSYNNASRANSLAQPSSGTLKSRMDDRYSDEPAEIRNIGSLLLYLRRAAVDREKLVLVRHFVENAGEDVYYLAEQMPTIMSLCVFQNSRRQLLTMLMEKCDAASKHRDEHKANGKDEGADEKRQIDNLLRAINAADEEVKRLEYWSDIRRMAREGHTGATTDNPGGWPSREWRGLDNSGPGKSMSTTAKEKGPSREEVRREAHEQIAPDRSDSENTGSESDKLPKVENETENARASHDGLETSDDARYTTAEEEPIRRDKGKGKVS